MEVQTQAAEVPAEPVDTQAAPPPDTSPQAAVPETQAAPADTNFDPSILPPELRSRYEATLAAREKEISSKYAGYDEAMTAKQQLTALTQHPAFRQWYAEQQNPQPKAQEKAAPEPELSPEKHVEIISDPKAMQSYINDLVERRANQLVMPEVQKTREQVQLMDKRQEIERFASAHPDFWDLDKQGKLEPVLRKYNSISIEDAYKLAKFDTLKKEAISEAHGIVSQKKQASVERPGVSSSRSSSGPIKAKNRQELGEIVADYHRRGLEAPDIEIG